jgi:hypothetical protein
LPIVLPLQCLNFLKLISNFFLFTEEESYLMRLNIFFVNRKSPYQLVEQWEALCSCFVNGRRPKDRELQVLLFNPFLEAKGGMSAKPGEDGLQVQTSWIPILPTPQDFNPSTKMNK